MKTSVSRFLQDLRYGVRVLSKAPATAAVAVLALALGIGVNISCFISVNALVLHPLPFPHLDRIMTIWETVPKVQTERDAVAPANYLDWKQQSRSFEEIGAYEGWDTTLTGTRDPQRVQAARVSPGFFGVLGSRAALGRTFSKEESQPAHSGVVVVSEGFWRQRLAGSRQAIGSAISLGGRSYTVVGVMPDDFDFPLATQVWTPLAMGVEEQHQRSAHDLFLVALLKRNVTVDQARLEAEGIAKRLAQQYPRTNEARGMTVVPLRSLINSVTERFVTTLLGAAFFVLLLACANVGNLQLARAAGREKEIAVRAALGAGRWQIARQLIAESVLLSLAGGAVALLLASWNLDFTKASIPPAAFSYVVGLRTMHIDFTVLLFTFAVSIATGILCCAPALFQLLRRASRANLGVALREGGRTTGGLPARSHLQSILIVSEMALALVLLIGAGFMVKTFDRLLAGYYGYDPRNLLLLQVSLPPTKYSGDASVVGFYDRVLRQLENLPGAQAASLDTESATADRFYIEGRPEPRPGEARPEVKIVGDRYLDSMRIPLDSGRFLSQQDRPQSTPVIVISQSLASHYWPHADPIGHRIKLGSPDAPWLTIVGVTGDVVQDWLSGRPALLAYLPYTQHPPHSAEFTIRTRQDPMQLAKEARSVIRKIDKDLPVYNVKSMERYITEQTHGVRISATTMSTYAAVALLLAATGIFAVISYFVVQRTHDIGVRMALGAGKRDVLTMTLRRTLRLTAAGLALGLPAAFGLMKLMSSLLYGIVKLDWTTFASCAAILAAAALLASYLPARRAAKIDPLVALRQE